MAQGGNPPFTLELMTLMMLQWEIQNKAVDVDMDNRDMDVDNRDVDVVVLAVQKIGAILQLSLMQLKMQWTLLLKECLKPAVPLPPLFPTVMKSVPFASEYAEEHQRVLKLNPSMHLPKQQLHDEVILTE